MFFITSIGEESDFIDACYGIDKKNFIENAVGMCYHSRNSLRCAWNTRCDKGGIVVALRIDCFMPMVCHMYEIVVYPGVYCSIVPFDSI